METIRRNFIKAYGETLIKRLPELCCETVNGRPAILNKITGQFLLLNRAKFDDDRSNYDSWVAYKRFGNEAEKRISRSEVIETLRELIQNDSVTKDDLLEFIAEYDPFLEIRNGFWRKRMEDTYWSEKNRNEVDSRLFF